MTQKAKDEFMGLVYYAADLESSFLAGSPRQNRKERLVASVVSAAQALKRLGAGSWTNVALIIALLPIILPLCVIMFTLLMIGWLFNKLMMTC